MAASSQGVSFEEFLKRVALSPEVEQAYRTALKRSEMNFQVTAHFADLICKQEEPARTQLLNIVLPPPLPAPFEGWFDPYGNVAVRIDQMPFGQHKYGPTGLDHVTNACFAHCQFCYKTRELQIMPTPQEEMRSMTRKVRAYVDAHPFIDNILVSGGDPFTLSTDKLTTLLTTLLESPQVRFVRIATKGLAFAPQRFFDNELLQFFERINRTTDKRVRVIAQYNHPAEFAEETVRALQALQGVGVQIYGQPVLLHGVNDSVETLTDLLRAMDQHSVIPYYLVTFMPVKGSEQYALPLHVAYELHEQAKAQVNGMAKKSMLIAAHNWGKFEILGFNKNRTRIYGRWHELAMEQYLPPEFEKPSSPGELQSFRYTDDIYCLDHLFNMNGLPFISG